MHRNAFGQAPLLHRERLAAVVKLATDAIIVIDDGGRIRLFNAAAERLFGCPEQDAIGSLLERFVPPRLRAPYRAGIDLWRRANAQLPHVGVPSIWWGLRSTGDTFPCEVTIAPCHVAGARELMVSVRDITRRRQAAKATRYRVEFERFLFDLSTSFIAIPEEGIDAHMAHGLARIGAFLEMGRVTLLELSDDRAAMTVAYSWSHPGVVGPAPVLTKQMEPWWLGRVMRGDVTVASHVDDLPEEAVAEKEYLRQRGVASVASIPLTVGGEIAGAMSFVTTDRHVSWTPELVNQLRIIGDVLWNALKRRQAMQALLAARETARESEERFRLIANTAPVMIWMSDTDKQISYVNQRWLDFSGWPRDAAPGRRWIELVHADDMERCADVYVSAFGQHKPFEVEHRLRRHDGEYRWAVNRGVPRFDVEGSFVGYIGTAVDVTERKLAAEALSTVRQRLIEAHEEERTRIARELHDDISQQVALLSLHLQRVKQNPSASTTRLEAEIGTAIQQTTDLDTDIRTLSHRLHSSKLEVVGLAAAAAGLCEEFSDRQPVEIDFQSGNISKTLPLEISLCLFRVLQEALQNAIKHSGSPRIRVVLADHGDDVELTVQDSGVGFDPQGAVRGCGLGLTSMRERLGLVGGQFLVHSDVGRGTTIHARVPLSSPTSSACA